MVVNILVFGDSVSYGAWDPEGGWVRRLRMALEEPIYKEAIGTKRYDLTADAALVYNLGITDETTDSIIVRFEGETKARLWKDDTVIFMIGKNDALLDNKTESLAVPPQKFEENLKKLIKLAKQYAKNVILVETLPIDEVRVDPVPWLDTHSYKSENIKKYNEIIKKVSEQENTGFIEIYSQLVGRDYEHLLEDGLHPNAEGHQFIFEKVRDYLIKHQIIDL